MRSSSPKRIQVDTSSPSSKKDNLVSSYHIQTYSPHRRSPVTRSSSYAGNAGSINRNDNGNETPKRTPPKAMSTTEELLFEDTFRNTLSSLKRMLLEYHSHQEFLSSPSGRKEERSQELINEEIRRTITKMQNLQQTNYSESYKIAAYSLIAAQLLDELNEALAQQSAVASLEKLRDEHEQLIQQYKSLQSHSSYDKAVADQKIESLEQENQSLKEQLSSLSRKRGTLVFELEARNRMEDDAHAKYVQLHIQIVNYHTKIQHMMNSLESGVRTRIGFIPRDVLTQINKVRNLPVPGADILYTRKTPRKSIDKGPILRSRSLDSPPSPSNTASLPVAPHTTPSSQSQNSNLTPSLERMTQHGHHTLSPLLSPFPSSSFLPSFPSPSLLEFYKQLPIPKEPSSTPSPGSQPQQDPVISPIESSKAYHYQDYSISPPSLRDSPLVDFHGRRGLGTRGEEEEEEEQLHFLNGKDKFEKYVEMKRNLYLMQSSLHAKESRRNSNGNGNASSDLEELSEELDEKLASRNANGGASLRKPPTPVLSRSYSSPDSSLERYGPSRSFQSPSLSPYSR